MEHNTVKYLWILINPIEIIRSMFFLFYKLRQRIQRRYMMTVMECAFHFLLLLLIGLCNNYYYSIFLSIVSFSLQQNKSSSTHDKYEFQLIKLIGLCENSYIFKRGIFFNYGKMESSNILWYLWIPINPIDRIVR